MHQAPAFFFPSNTIFIDDDVFYAKLIISDIVDCPSVSVTSEVDSILNQKNRDLLFLADENNRNSGEIFATIKSDLRRQSSSLSGLVSVLIVDLNMATINGLDLLREIKSPFIYKVLISNYIGAKSNDAVRLAQNSGVIDEVILKDRSLVDSLPKLIHRGQTKFFTRLSTNLFTGKEIHHYLADTAIASKFLEITNRFEPDTIWPDETLTSFTLTKKNAPDSFVFFTTQQEIDALIASYDADQIPWQTLKRLTQEDHILCHKNPHTLNVEEWPYYLRPAQKIQGTNGAALFHITTEKDITYR